MPVLMASLRGTGRRVGALCAAVAVGLALGASGTAAQGEAEAIVARYARRRTISEGTGPLEAHREAHVESGVYELEIRADAGGARTMFLDVERSFRDQGGPTCLAGTERAHAEVDLETRLYRGATELEAGAPSGASVWLWAPPSIPRDSTLRVLDRELRVERGVVLDVAMATVPAILAEVSGEGQRDAPPGFAGELGRFRTHWSLSLWFDEATGYLLRSERWEIADREDASFEEHDVLWMTDAPYLPERARTPHLPVHDCSPARVDRNPLALRVGIPFSALFAVLGALALARRRAAGGDA
jgi:hypothetical protein